MAARSVEACNQYIVTALVANFAAIGITIDSNLWSKRNVLRAICYTIAIAQSYFEQLADLFLQQVEAQVAVSSASTPPWIQDNMFKFQYDATVPQVLQLDTTTMSYYYPTVDPTLRIITACSVKANISGQVRVKIAKENPFVALIGPELSAAQSYADIKFTAGITYLVTSAEADRIYIQADIWYQGLYSATIQADVITAINNFFQQASLTNFDGSIRLSDIERVIRDVSGVNDIVLVNVRARQNADVFADGTDLVLNQLEISRLWNTIAGYAIQEDTAGKTFADTLNFIAE